MTRTEEVSNPRSCFNKAGVDELIFVLLERDEAAAETIRFWVRKRIELDLNTPGDEKIKSALALADSMESGKNR